MHGHLALTRHLQDMQAKRIALALALPLLLASVATTAACAGEEEQVEQLEAQTVFLRVTAENIESLAPGEELIVDQTRPNTSWIFDGSKGAIDYSRVTIVCPGNVRMPITSWFTTMGTQPLDGHTDEWLLVNDPKDFGTLSPDQAQEMRDIAELLREDEFRAPANHLEEVDVDGVSYWVCYTDESYLCPGGQWEPL